ncbi:Mechanosensitive ion channel MscS domain-containing protein [Plasmodiophora brassicae]|nr:hypothetical protein PBRA_006058 [Plasmodiophora brassicae]
MVRRALHQSIVYGWRKQRFSEQALAIVSLGRVLQRMCCSDDKDIDVVRSQLPPVATFVQQWQSLLRPLTLPMRYVRSSDSKTAVFDLNSAAVFTSPTDQPELARALFDNFVRSTAVAAPQTPKGVAGIAGWQRLFRDRKLALSAFDAMFAKYVQFDRRRPITFRLFRDALDNYMLRRDQLVSSISTFDDLTQVIDGVASFAFWLIMLYIVVTLYGGSGGELLTSLSAFLISFAFAFGTPISQTVVSIMYIFIQKPFDVGDRLRIDKDEFIVQKMNLLTTTLRSDDNSLRVVVNQQLANSPLTNLSRTSSAIVIVSVQVPIEMSAAAMRDFRTQLSNFLSMNEDQWFPVLHIFVVDCTGDKGPLSLTVRAQLRLGWDDAQQALLCRSRFVDSIRRALLANTGSKVVINPEDEEKDA